MPLSIAASAAIVLSTHQPHIPLRPSGLSLHAGLPTLTATAVIFLGICGYGYCIHRGSGKSGEPRMQRKAGWPVAECGVEWEKNAEPRKRR